MRYETKNEVKIAVIAATMAENELRKFDLNPRYGPFVGISRKERFDRALRFGLSPPDCLRELIEG